MGAHFYIAKAVTNGPLRFKKVPRATAKKLEATSKVAANKLRLTLVKDIAKFKKRVDVSALAVAWQRSDYHRVMAQIPWRDLPKDFSPSLEAIQAAAAQGIALEIFAIPGQKDRKLRFDLSNPRLKHYINQKQHNLVNLLQADAQENIQTAIASAFTNAQSPRQVAEAIKSSIGLTPVYAGALQKYHQGLLAQEVKPERAQTLADAYEERLLDARAMNIARTEVGQAMQTGQMLVLQEGAAQGFFNPETARRVWVVDGDPCPICEPMDGEEVGLDEGWEVEYSNGSTKTVMIPRESHPSCFCEFITRFGKDEE